jgi:Protein of unknown function (DUF402)
VRELWRPGDEILLRHLFRGRVLIASPLRVVEHTPELLVTWLAPWTPYMRPTRRVPVEWELENRPWHPPGALQLTRPGDAYSLWLLRRDARAFSGWYVNLQNPLRPSPLGFDTRDHLLDLWRPANGDWVWKDEHELEQAVEEGIFSPPEAAAIRAEGERATRELELPTGWESWEPDPSWPVPSLPTGWDEVA